MVYSKPYMFTFSLEYNTYFMLSRRIEGGWYMLELISVSEPRTKPKTEFQDLELLCYQKHTQDKVQSSS